MTSIIENWLLKVIGVKLLGNAENIGEACFDGTLYAKILLKYGLCSEKYIKNIIKTEKSGVAYNNLKKLCIWFKLLEVPYTDEDLKDIANKNENPALKLLYELFLRLEKSKNIEYNDGKELEEPINGLEFQHNATTNTCDAWQVSFDKYLRENRDRERDRNLIQKCLLKNKVHKKTIANLLRKKNKYSSKIEPKDTRRSKTEATYLIKQTMEFDERLKNQDKPIFIDKQLPDAFISLLKIKHRQGEAAKLLEYSVNRETIAESWRHILMYTEKETRDILAKQLHNQSEYEKQVALQLRKSRLRYRKFIENKNRMFEDEGKYKSSSDVVKTSILDIKHKTLSKYEAEKLRIRKLHDDLWREKMKVKYQIKYKICRSILEDIVDFTLMHQAYINEFKVEPSKEKILEWKSLFLKGEPFFERKCIETEPDKDVIKLDHVCIEKEVELEVNYYIFLSGPWDPRQFPSTAKGSERFNIISHLVQRLLDAKYMPRSSNEPVPHYENRVLIRPVISYSDICKIKEYLGARHFAVFDKEDAIDYAIQSYDQFINGDQLVTSAIPEEPLAKKNPPSRHKGTDINEKEMKKPSMQKGLKPSYSMEIKFKEIGVQVPNSQEIKTEEEIKDITGAVVLGKLMKDLSSYSIGGLGIVLTVLSIIEYIKHLTGVKGWVLINFPDTMKELAVLEYLCSGWKPPIYSTGFWSKVENYLSVINEILKKYISKPNSEKDLSPDQLEQILCRQKELVSPEPLTCLEEFSSEQLDLDAEDGIEHKCIPGESTCRKPRIFPKSILNSSGLTCRSIFSRVIHLHKEHSNSDPSEEEAKLGPKLNFQGPPINSGEVERFYCNIGLSNPLFFKTLSPDVLESLENIILKVFMAEENLSNETYMNGSDELKKSQKVSSSESSVCSVETIVEKISSNNSASEDEIKNNNEEYQKKEENIVYPGHCLWSYSKPNDAQVFYEPLATVWETMEYFYISNLSEAFTVLKVMNSQSLPYRNFILQKSQECILFSDNRGNISSDFQVMLNGINDKSRSKKSVKKKLKCLVFDLQCYLWKLADVKKETAEEVLHRLKNDIDLKKRLANYLKFFFCIIQTELDRFIDTVQLITDYYCICITKSPSTKRFNKIFLPKFERNRNSTTSCDNSFQKTNCYKASFRKTQQETEKANHVLAMHFDGQMVPVDDTQDTLKILTSIKKMLNLQVDDVKIECSKIYKDVLKNIMPLRKSTSTSLSPSSSTNLKNVSTLTDEKKMMLEWAFALDDETDRISLRIGLIIEKALKSVNEQISMITDAFEDFHKDIVHQYHKELFTIDKLCDFLKLVIAEGLKIEPPLLLELDKIFVNPNWIYNCPPPPPPTPNVGIPVGYQFTTQQLCNFFHKMSHVAPRGVLKKTFIYILEDMACMGHELGHPYLPPIWSSLTSENISYLINKWFGEKPVISWKEFIIFALDLRYPTIEEILTMKREFESYDPERLELIPRETFFSISLWFETRATLRETSQKQRLSRSKELLFQLFEVEGRLNYTCFLLAFCRDENPIEGFMKALAAIEGCLTVSWKGEKFHEESQLEKELEKYFIARDILDLILNLVDYTFAVKIWDYFSDTEGEYDEYVSYFDSNYHRSYENGWNTFTSERNTREFLQASFEEFEAESYEKPRLRLQSSRFSESLTNSVMWKSEVHIDTVLSLFVFYKSYYAFSPKYLYQDMKIAKNLKKIFAEKGNGYMVTLETLLGDCYIKEILTSYRLFQPIYMSKYLSMFKKKNMQT